ncbi:hypothetical protein [Streptomyces sp. M92]|uniref:hypothetical protein n=1 Tax=Streptomyces sp. M92 TaxID=2944250 RepID=UPI00234BEF88|nr:hypothetical protein [Streptomyces sp. M92]WCN01883.1 hypothetical protein M6G08_07305 [Streptomyces sp. M92]
MRLRRSLSVAAAVAVATPVVLLTSAPAFAAGTPSAQTQHQPTYAELEKAAADAAKEYEDALAAEKEGRKTVDAAMAALDSDTHPLKAATITAAKAAKDAADAEAAAEKAVTDARAAVEAAGTDAEKAEAQLALEAAETDLAEAVGARQEADAAAEAAQTALDDARVAAVRAYGKLKTALDKALEAKEAAEEALGTAKECVREDGLTALAVGLPSKVVAGTTVDFTLRVTNGSERTLDVDPLAFVHVKGEGSGAKGALKVKWSDGSGWKTLGGNRPEHIAPVDTMKPGEHSDVKLRMKVAAGAGAADAFALFAADASSAYKPCVLGPMKRYDFELLPADSDPGPVDEADPGKPGKDDDKRPDTAGTGTSPQGGTPQQTTQTVDTVRTSATGTGGTLAQTGTSPALAPLGIASAVAVALGAGTVVAARRRRAADNA